MTTPTHVAFDVSIVLVLAALGFVIITVPDIFALLLAQCIDFDHFFSKPIYHPKRNPFKTHLFHKYWMIVALVSIGLLFYRPLLFLGIGLLSHLFLDYAYVRIHRL